MTLSQTLRAEMEGGRAPKFATAQRAAKRLEVLEAENERLRLWMATSRRLLREEMERSAERGEEVLKLRDKVAQLEAANRV